MIRFEYDEINHQTWCYIQVDNEHLYIGQAKCNPEDYDMENKRTGEHIAYSRALVEALRGDKYALNERLAALNQLYYSMNRSKKFQPKSYENRMLQRQIRQIKNDLDIINYTIADEKQKLNMYIEEKDKFYKRIRSHRNTK